MFSYYPQRNPFYSSPYVPSYPLNHYYQPAPTYRVPDYYSPAYAFDPYPEPERLTRREYLERERLRRAADEQARRLRLAERARQEADLERLQSAYEPDGYGRPRRAARAPSSAYTTQNDEDDMDDQDAYDEDPLAALFGLPYRHPRRARPATRPKPEAQPAKQSEDREVASAAHEEIPIKVVEDSTTPASASPSAPTNTDTPTTRPTPSAPTLEQRAEAASKIQGLVRAHQALVHIRELDSRFAALQRVFAFPATVDFQVGSSTVSVPITITTRKSPPSAPHVDRGTEAKLAYTPNNAPLHAYAEELSRLLIALDEVQSCGSRKVCERRKNVVKRVEAEAQRVDGLWRGMWEARLSEQQDADMLDAMEVASTLYDTQAILSDDAKAAAAEPRAVVDKVPLVLEQSQASDHSQTCEQPRPTEQSTAADSLQTPEQPASTSGESSHASEQSAPIAQQPAPMDSTDIPSDETKTSGNAEPAPTLNAPAEASIPVPEVAPASETTFVSEAPPTVEQTSSVDQQAPNPEPASSEEHSSAEAASSSHADHVDVDASICRSDAETLQTEGTAA